MKVLIGDFNQESSNFSNVRFELYYLPRGNVGPVSIRHISQHHCPPPHRAAAASKVPRIIRRWSRKWSRLQSAPIPIVQHNGCLHAALPSPNTPTGSSATVRGFACSQHRAVAILHGFGIKLFTNSLMVTKLNGGQKLQCGGDLISVTISWLLTVRVCNRFHIAAL